METLKDIRADLWGLKAPCRVMDCRIAFALGYDQAEGPAGNTFREHWQNHLRMEAAAGREGIRVTVPLADLYGVPRYTSDIEAVLDISRENEIKLRSFGPDWHAAVDNYAAVAIAHTPVIAALVAALEIEARSAP